MMNKQEQLAIETTNRILSKLQNEVSTRNEITRIIKRSINAFVIMSITSTAGCYIANQYHPDSLGIKTALFFMAVCLIRAAWFATCEISQLPEKPLGEKIYKMCADYVNRRTPNHQNIRQYTVTVTENINAKRK
jgi:hypothetical protein